MRIMLYWRRRNATHTIIRRRPETIPIRSTGTDFAGIVVIAPAAAAAVVIIIIVIVIAVRLTPLSAQNATTVL